MQVSKAAVVFGRSIAAAVVSFVAAGLVGVVAPSVARAGGSVTCSQSAAGVMQINLEQDDSFAQLSRVGLALRVNADLCPGATVVNTTRINVDDTSSRGSTAFVIDLSGGPISSESGDEIPVFVDLRAGELDTFGVSGSGADDFWTFGGQGANLQKDSAAEVRFQSSLDIGFGLSRGGDDRLCASGGRGTQGSGIFSWVLNSGAGDDTVCGGSLTDSLSGATGADRVKGSGGGDVVKGGGGGDDLSGGRGGDLLKGGDGDDELNGGPGADTCRGGPGADRLRRCE
jgi:hypothetical protein